MGFSEKNIVRTQLGAVNAVLYTVPAATTTVLKNIHFTNTTGGVKKVTLYLVDNGDSPTDANKLFNQTPVPSSGILEYCGWKVLDTPGDTIQGFADSGASVTLHVDGAEIS